MKNCPFCSLVDDHDDKCYFTLKAAGAMSGDLQRAWDRRATSDSSHVIPPTRGAGSQHSDERAALERAAEYLEHYAKYLYEVRMEDIERHPYIPSIEEAASELRAMAVDGGAELTAGAAKGGNTSENGGLLDDSKTVETRMNTGLEGGHLGTAPAAGTDKDAERYRHIRDTANNGCALNGPAGIGKWQVSRKMCGGVGEFFFGERMDAMIDRDIAAIGAHTNKESTK